MDGVFVYTSLLKIVSCITFFPLSIRCLFVYLFHSFPCLILGYKKHNKTNTGKKCEWKETHCFCSSDAKGVFSSRTCKNRLQKGENWCFDQKFANALRVSMDSMDLSLWTSISAFTFQNERSRAHVRMLFTLYYCAQMREIQSIWRSFN